MLGVCLKESEIINMRVIKFSDKCFFRTHRIPKLRNKNNKVSPTHSKCSIFFIGKKHTQQVENEKE